MKPRITLFLLLHIALCLLPVRRGLSQEPASFPSLVSSVRVHGPLEFCNEPVPLDIQEVRERMEKELLLSLWDRPQVILWLKRSRRYLPHIESLLKKNGMPADLKYVAVAESALRPHAGSKKGAIGYWQFMKDTGRKYGLVINQYVDERRNLSASTEAAIRYFKKLYQLFGSWTVAAAAYNAGEEGVRAEILEQQTTDYYELYLPLETQRFVFRILSAKLILSDPENYGFRLSPDDYYPPLNFDSLQLECAQETPIRIIAEAANTRFKVIKDLNPELRGHYLAPGSHTLLIPKGRSNVFHKRYERLVNEWVASRSERIYVVRAGDTLTAIADRFNVPLAALIIWNRIDLSDPIHPGDRLVIHYQESDTRGQDSKFQAEDPAPERRESE